MNPAMLDTDILSEYLRNNPNVVAKVSEYIKEYDAINLSIITYYEILNGLLYKDARRQLSTFEAFVKLNRVIPLTLPMAKTAAEIQSELRRKGIEIGHTDTLIAGIALTSGLQLITNNTQHFQRIPKLDIANWTA
jgi:predicted nucleic acid-binding protein